MTSLREAQERFAALMLGDDGVQPRLEIYRRNGAAIYRQALAASYPVVRRLVGVPFFEALVDDFVHAHPSRSGDLNEYGAELPMFLAHYGPTAALPYLHDVAALEWALDEAARSGSASLSPAEVAAAFEALPAERLAAVTVGLHPAARLLGCEFGAMRIWRVHQPDWQGAIEAEVARAPEWLLVMRAQGRVFVERIAGAEHAWLGALQRGSTFECALHAGLAVDSDFDLGAVLARRIADGTLVAVHAA
jgi:hypothetical protein